MTDLVSAWFRRNVGLGSALAFALACPSPAAPPTAATDEVAATDARSLPISDVSGDPIIVAMVEASSTNSRVDEHLRYLAEDIGPRLTSSKNLSLAETWALEQFRSWGLDARLEKWGDMPVGFDRGKRSGGMVLPERIEFDFTTPAWTPGLSQPTRGQAIAYPSSFADFKRMQPRLPGAWIVMPSTKAGSDALDARMRARIDRGIDEARVAGYVYAAGAPDSELVHTSGHWDIEWDELPTRVQIKLRGDQHADLSKRLAAGDVVQLQFSIDNRFTPGPIPQHNVVADLAGTEFPDELVIVGGHLDSWDGASGAVDNATGVATTMEAARLLREVGAKPRRTIRFVLWTGEEQGLLGSTRYVEMHADELERTSAVLVHDHGTNFISGIQATPEMMPALREVFAPVQRLDAEMPFELREVEGLVIDASDHAPYIRKGVPAFFWLQEGDVDYARTHHTQFDHIDAVVPRYQRHSALVVAIAAWNLAQLDNGLDRTNSAPIPPRRLGVQVEGMVVREVVDDSAAHAAGWRLGDRLMEIEGKKFTDLESLLLDLQGGPARRTVTVERQGKKVETIIDYSNDPGELERARRRKARGG